MSSVADEKQKTHIVEYVLYVWQMEDVLRATQFSENAIRDMLGASSGPDLDWLIELARKMKAEKLEEQGHVSSILEVQTELALLHDLLTGPMEDEVYVSAFETAQPVLREFEEQKMTKGLHHPTEVMLTALYGWLVLKMQKKSVSPETQAALQPIREMANSLARGHVRIYQGN